MSSTSSAVAALVKNTGEQKTNLTITDASMKIRARNENSQSGGGTAEAFGAIGNVDMKVEGAPITVDAGRPQDEEERTNMIYLFRNEILKGFPYDKTCDLVDELMNLGCFTKDSLEDLTEADINNLKMLPLLQKRKLNEYLQKSKQGC